MGNSFVIWGTRALVEGVGCPTKASREIRLCLGRDLTSQAR